MITPRKMPPNTLSTTTRISAESPKLDVSNSAIASGSAKTQRRQNARPDELPPRDRSSSTLGPRQSADALVRRQSADVSVQLSSEDSFFTARAHASSGEDSVRTERMQQVRNQLVQKLSTLEFEPDLSEAAMQEQLSLEQQHIEHAIMVLNARIDAYLGATHALGVNMRTQSSEAFLPILLSSTQGFITSALRSPIRNITLLGLDPKKAELSSEADRAWTAGAPSGLTAYGAAEILTDAIGRRAKAGNLRAIHSVNIAAVLPAPNTVVLEVVGNRKSYVKLDPAGARYAKLKVEHEIRKRNLLQWQAALAGKGAVAPWIQPILTGGTNLARRALADRADIFTSGRLFWSAAAASGVAGAATKAILGGLQVTPRIAQAKVDDFAGGEQMVNLFEVRAPNPRARPARVTDLPRGFVRTVAEAAALVKHSVNPTRGVHELLLQGQDVVRYVLSNMTASFASAFMGLGAGDIIRKSLVRSEDELFNSSANLLQQFIQSGSNELVWKAMLDHKKEGAYSIGASLDAARDITEAGYHDMATKAFKQVRLIRQSITPERQERLPQSWKNALPSIDQMLDTDSPDIQAVRLTLKILQEAEESTSSSENFSLVFTRSNMLAHLNSMNEALNHRERLQQYRLPTRDSEHQHNA
jgi:hypothetical protein